MGAFVYGGRFQHMMNSYCSPGNISDTARKFVEFERLNGPYSFGKFTKFLFSNPEEFASWETDAGGIPKVIQQRLTEIISTNLRSAHPMPTVLKVGENVDGTHDLQAKIFAHDKHLCIGLLMLCPNTELK